MKKYNYEVYKITNFLFIFVHKFITIKLIYEENSIF